MQPREKINKSTWTLVEGVKDSVTTNITTAMRTGQLKIEAAQVPTLLALLAASIDEGYHKGNRTFMKTVDVALAEAALPDLAKKK
jgi:hypothetical protein